MKEEFLRIYNLYKNDILRLSYSITKRMNDAEDITQNVFIKYYKCKNIFLNDNQIKHWLIKVTINESKDLFKSFWRKNFMNNNNELDNVSTTDKEYLEIKEALFKLTNKQRIIIYLFYYEGYKVKEISDILKINSSTIQTILNRTRKELKDLLGGN